MTPPVALSADASVARNRAAVMAELRRLLPGPADGMRKTLPFGLAALDSHLPDGGLTCGAVHEIVPAAERAFPAAFGFIAATLACLAYPSPLHGEGSGVGVGRFCKGVDRVASPPDPHFTLARRSRFNPLVVVMPAYGLRPYGRRAGRLHGHGLGALGLDPTRAILVEAANRKDTLWAMEEALRSTAPAAVIGLIDQLDLKLSQRLHLAATDAGLPLFLLRPMPPTLPSPARGGGWGGGSASATRWRVGTALAARDRFGLIARPRWHLQLERCRNGRPGQWVVEYDHVAHRFSLAAALADPAYVCGAEEKSFRQAG